MDVFLMRQDSWARFLHHTYVIKYCFLLCCMTHLNTNEFDLKRFSSQTLNNIVPFLCFRCAHGFFRWVLSAQGPVLRGICLNREKCAVVSKAGVPGSPSCVCPLGSQASAARSRKTPLASPTTLAPMAGSAHSSPTTSTNASVPVDGQVRSLSHFLSLFVPLSLFERIKHYFSKVLNWHFDSFVIVFVLLLTFSPQVSIVSKRIHVCPAHVPTVVSAMLCPIVNSLVPVLLVTMAPVVSMTQMSVPSPHLCARTKVCALIPQAHIDVTANPALLASTARRITCPAFHPPVSMVEPAEQWQTQLIYATACQVSSLGEEI